MGWQQPAPKAERTPRNRAIRTFIVLLVAVLLFAVAADLAGLGLPRGIGWLIGLPIALVGAWFSYGGTTK